MKKLFLILILSIAFVNNYKETNASHNFYADPISSEERIEDQTIEECLTSTDELINEKDDFISSFLTHHKILHGIQQNIWKPPVNS